MCFVLHKNHASVQIAQQDINVYKIMRPSGRNRITSPFMYFDYTNKSEQKEILLIAREERRELWTVECGYHSYSNIEIAIEKNVKAFMYHGVYEFVIPAGSRYYFNPDDNEYVSSKIRLKSFRRVDKSNWFRKLLKWFIK